MTIDGRSLLAVVAALCVVFSIVVLALERRIRQPIPGLRLWVDGVRTGTRHPDIGAAHGDAGGVLADLDRRVRLRLWAGRWLPRTFSTTFRAP